MKIISEFPGVSFRGFKCWITEKVLIGSNYHGYPKDCVRGLQWPKMSKCKTLAQSKQSRAKQCIAKLFIQPKPNSRHLRQNPTLPYSLKYYTNPCWTQTKTLISYLSPHLSLKKNAAKAIPKESLIIDQLRKIFIFNKNHPPTHQGTWTFNSSGVNPLTSWVD